MVKVIPQEEIKEKESPAWVAFFWFSVIALITIISLFFIFHLNTKKINEELDQVQKKTDQISNEEKQNLKTQAAQYKNKIDIIPSLLEAHLISSSAFDVIERNVHPKIVFNSFSLITKEKKAVLSGFAEDMISLAQQMRIFEREKTNIDKVKLANAELVEGAKIGFKVDVFFTDEIFSIKK